MRKHAAALIGTAALIGAALPALVAAPASASGAIRCQPVAHRYVVTKSKAPVHKTPRPGGTVIGHVYKGQHVVSRYECDNSDGTWECISRCQVSDNGDDSFWGNWVYRGYLRQG